MQSIFFFQVVRKSDNDQVTVLGCCVTLKEAMLAADKLAIDGVNIRIIDPFTLKPFDKDTVLASARETGGRIITVEDHYSEGDCFYFYAKHHWGLQNVNGSIWVPYFPILNKTSLKSKSHGYGSCSQNTGKKPEYQTLT